VGGTGVSVCVAVGVFVRVGVDVGGTGVFVRVAVAVAVGGTGVFVRVGVAVGGTGVFVRVGVRVAVAVAVAVAVGVPPLDAGRTTNTLNSGPVGLGAMAPTGVATDRPVIGSTTGLPSNVPLSTGAPKKSAALRTSNPCPSERMPVRSTDTVLWFGQL
jgi:hypothetical protein